MTLECAHCKAALGAEAKRAPVSTCDVHGGSLETWCPQCFAWVRAPMEPARYFADAMTPLSCALCGWESLALGAPRCVQCRSTLTVALGMPRIVRA
jgi:hypothetical protein